MTKRSLDVQIGNLSEGSSGEKQLDPAKLSAQTIRAQARIARTKLLPKPPNVLTDGFDVADIGGKYPWFMRQSLNQLLEIFNAYCYPKKRFFLSFTRLGEIASLCRLMYKLFQDVEYNCWIESALARTGLNLKFHYIPEYLNKRRHPNFDEPVYGGVVAYLNLFGLGHCEGCGMYLNFSAKTDERNDYIPISPFRELTPEEAAAAPEYDDSNLYNTADFSTKPDHLMNLLIIRDKIKTRYCCVHCGTLLNKSICGFPAVAVPEACNSRSNGRAKHVRTDLDNEVVAPKTQALNRQGVLVTVPGKVLRQMFMYCIRCGLLKLQGDEDDSSSCKHCDGDEENNCCCKACPLCKKMPKKCKCIVCNHPNCMKCKADDCSKLCQADPCVCDVSSASSESSSSESSESGF
jgi:hypothetical protein